MIGDSQGEQIRNLFKLNEKEKILEEISCSIVETIPLPGKLYLSENYICFYANYFVYNKKIAVPFTDITELKLKKSNIEIEVKNNKKNKLSFTSFTNTQQVYKKIKLMCKKYNENKKDENLKPIILSDFENPEEEDKASTKTSSSSKKEYPKLNSPKLHSKPKAKSLLIDLNSDSNLSEIQKCKSSNFLKNGEIFQNSLKENENLNEAEKQKRGSLNSSGQINKSIGESQNILNSPDKKENPQEEEMILDEEKEIVFSTLDDSIDTEMCRKIFNMSPKTFFERFQTNKYPETCYSKFYEWVGDYTDINIPDWEKIENPENPDIPKYKREESFGLALRGVPLINKTNVVKTSVYWVDKDGTYYIKSKSRSQGVPLSDYFIIETTLEFHPYMNNTKTVFRTFIRVNMLKSTVFKYALLAQGRKNYSLEVNKWLQFLETKGEKSEGDYVYNPKKRRNSLGRSSTQSNESNDTSSIEAENENEKHIVDFSDFCKDVFFGIFKYTKLMYDYFNREFDYKTRAIMIFCFFLFFVLLSVIQGQNNEIYELKNELSEMKGMLKDLKNITLGMKKVMENKL